MKAVQWHLAPLIWVVSKREQASGRGKEYHSGCKGQLLGFQKGGTDCKRVEWLENIVNVQEKGCAPPGGVGKTVALEECWRLAAGMYRQAVWNSFAWRQVGRARRFMDGVTCDDMSGEVHIQLLSRGDTSGEVRRAGLRAGRFVEAGPRAGSSPFLFVCGDDRVIRYTGADVDTGGAEDAQMAE
ncbi:hypothetical protein DEO72_LG1g3271 [Vigna unguiculata]|uniref:Uncharacterized protein n=1 Tax=Vigna unguiculata TaxID=3917 RepID=A0A4D6KSV9_VIGUN|nr:hypothetical protein DEO72_LG1g3271 [Vigna unguiculata]